MRRICVCLRRLRGVGRCGPVQCAAAVRCGAIGFEIPMAAVRV